MSKNTSENLQKKLEGLLGESTPAKVSGLAYSLAPVIAAVLSVVFFIVISLLGAEVKEGETYKNWYLYCNFLLPQLGLFLVAWLCKQYSKAPLKETAGAQICSFRYFVIAILMQIGLLSLSQLNTLFLSWLGKFGYQDAGISLPSMDGFGFVGVFFTVAVLPAIMEELIFRGVLLNGLKTSFPEWAAVLLCGALFSLYHQNPAQTIYQFCCGAAFALVAIKAGSIFPTVLSHFLNNAVIVVLNKFGITAFPAPVLITVICVSAVCLVGTLLWLIFKEKTDGNKNKDKSEQKRFFLFAAVGIGVCLLSWIAVLFSGI